MKNELIKTEIIVKDTPISVIRIDKIDFISLTDLAKYQNSSDPSFTVKNWSDIKGITILNSKNKDCCGMFDEPFGSSKKMNINQLINKI